MFSMSRSGDVLAETTTTVVERVRRTAIVDMGGATFPDLDRCVIDAVARLSGGTVAGFVPLLALREVRCCIAAGSCDCGTC